jgi:hypothetical protein
MRTAPGTGGRQPQAPFTQLPKAQKLKQPPQWALSVSVFTQPSGQQVSPLAQQTPWQQGPAHLFPHAPQLSLVVRSAQTLLQQLVVELTRQTPLPQQTSPGAARQAPLLQGGRPVPRQTQVPLAATVPLQNWPLGQQTRSGPHGGWPLVHWQNGAKPAPGS